MKVDMALRITEKQFEHQVKGLAKLFQWKYYHTWRSIHSPAGFPDCVLVRPPRLIFAELKSMKGVVSPEQQVWITILSECRFSEVNPIGIEVYLWRPADFEKIADILK